MRRAAVLSLCAAVLPAAGCGRVVRESAPTGHFSAPHPVAVAIGRGPRFRPPAPRTLPAGTRCAGGARRGVHLELFAAGRVVVVAPGIGIAGGRLRRGRVVAARCSAAVRTTDPTGVLELAPGRRTTLGAFFALWRQPLSQRRLAGFHGDVRAWVNGHRVPGDPRSLALRPHAEVVLVVGRQVPVHAGFVFRAGL